MATPTYHTRKPWEIDTAFASSETPRAQQKITGLNYSMSFDAPTVATVGAGMEKKFFADDGHERRRAAKANAELIVTAVNAHDALMAVYEAAKAYSGMGFPREGSDRTHHITMRNRVHQALAAADAVIGEVK
jgi:hypothetical protein